MKVPFFSMLAILSAFGLVCTVIWTLVEAARFALSDHIFNWNSVWGVIGSIVAIIVFVYCAAFAQHKERNVHG
jgi:uncharacterized BrkB/YihY/UPF0761 family membrane protein